MSIRDQRKLIRQLVDDTSPTQAPTAYYALYHDPARSTLATAIDDQGRALGFVGRFQTGHDLFRPLVTMRCKNAAIAADLMADALVVGRPYLFFANLNQLPLVGKNLEFLSQKMLHIYTLDRARFAPTINVLVVEKAAQDGSPRFEIHSGGLQAVSGVNWISPAFAELYVFTEPEARQRGWGRSVASACTAHLLKDARQPLYLVEKDNDDSLSLAAALGYVDSGARQIYAEVIYRGHPEQQNIPVERSEGANSR